MPLADTSYSQSITFSLQLALYSPSNSPFDLASDSRIISLCIDEELRIVAVTCLQQQQYDLEKRVSSLESVMCDHCPLIGQ